MNNTSRRLKSKMLVHFRRVISAALVLAFALGASGAVNAQAYPSKPVRLVIPIAAGGGTDIIGRLIAQKLAAAMGQQFIVDNRPGAGGIIGSELVAKSPADGYVLLLVPASHTINPVA